MAVAATDLKFYYSGGSGITVTDNVPSDTSLSIGGGIGPAIPTDAAHQLHNLFPKINGDQAETGRTDYRVIYLKNDNSEDDAERVILYLTKNYDSSTGTEILGTDDSGNDISFGIQTGLAVNADFTALTNETTAPTNVTFDQGYDASTGVEVASSLPHGEKIAIILKREIRANADAKDEAEIQFTIQADTPE